MMRRIRELDWHRFWLQQVVFLSVPMLLMVILSRDNPPLDKRHLIVLLVVFLVMTMLNVIQIKFAKGRR